ncbi:MAG: carbamoyltransferase HypF, partial [Chloroflexota bacterium]|nr:carbamoyltransferase HypF [Chloroflexota bacterium]
ARHPVQAAAGFLFELDDVPDLIGPPFAFPDRYRKARELVEKGIRTFPTTSVGRLFDTVAALLGFTREISFEGQAAIWLEHLARTAPRAAEAYPAPFTGEELDFRPTLEAVIEARKKGGAPAEIARAFQRGLVQGVYDALLALCEAEGLDTVVLSGGVFQNDMLLQDLKGLLEPARIQLWVNHQVPPNDGGISLGQVALALSKGRG